MKKIFMIMVTAALICSLCACSNQTNSEPSSDSESSSDVTAVENRDEPSTENSQQSETVDVLETYTKPSKTVALDLSKSDPATSEMQFNYNEDGSIRVCRYMIGTQEIAITYSYDGNQIEIYAFSGDILVANEIYSAKSAYDANVGFAEYEGYYFKGFEF